MQAWPRGTRGTRGTTGTPKESRTVWARRTLKRQYGRALSISGDLSDGQEVGSGKIMYVTTTRTTPPVKFPPLDVMTRSVLAR